MSWSIGRIIGTPKAVRKKVEAYKTGNAYQMAQWEKVKPFVLEQIDKADVAASNPNNPTGIQVDASGHAAEGPGSYNVESLSFSVTPIHLELEPPAEPAQPVATS